MDPQCSAQDVLRCDQCEAPAVSISYKVSRIKLCKDCEKKNCQEMSHPHQDLPHPQGHSITQNPQCAKHAGKQCQLNCITCDVPVCATCTDSKEHSGHIFSNVDHEAGDLGNEHLSANFDKGKTSIESENLSKMSISSQEDGQEFTTAEIGSKAKTSQLNKSQQEEQPKIRGPDASCPQTVACTRNEVTTTCGEDMKFTAGNKLCSFQQTSIVTTTSLVLHGNRTVTTEYGFLYCSAEVHTGKNQKRGKPGPLNSKQ